MNSQKALAEKLALEAKLKAMVEAVAKSKSECSADSKQAQRTEARLSGTQEALTNAQDALKNSEDIMHSLERQKARCCQLVSSMPARTSPPPIKEPNGSKTEEPAVRGCRRRYRSSRRSSRRR